MIRRIYIDPNDFDIMKLERLFDYRELDDLREYYQANAEGRFISTLEQTREEFIYRAGQTFSDYLKANPHLIKVYERDRPDHYKKDIFYSVKIWTAKSEAKIYPQNLQISRKGYSLKKNNKAA